MENNVYFMHRIKHLITPASGQSEWDKGIEVKDSGTAVENYEAAKQAYHAYMGAYGYGHDNNVDFVSCTITDSYGNIVNPFNEAWQKREEPVTPEE